MTKIHFIGLWILLAGLHQGTATLGKPPLLPEEEIDKLISQLGDDQFKVREEATRQLISMRQRALLALRKAANAEDLEVRLRARLIIERIQRLQASEQVASIVARAKRGEMDQFIDQIVERRTVADDACWEAVLGLARQMAESATQVSGKAFSVPRHDFLKGAVITDLLSEKSNLSGKRVLTDDLRAASYIHSSLVICRGPLETKEYYLYASIIFTNGPIKVGGYIRNSIIFCNGDIRVSGYIWGSVIVATGEVYVDGYIHESLLEVKAAHIRHGYSSKSIYLNLKTIDTDSSREDRTIPTEVGPLRLFRFFDPVQVGLDVTVDMTGARLVKVHAGSVFANAGFQKNDLIIALDGHNVKSLVEFKSLLRRYAMGDAVDITFSRSEKKLKRVVLFSESNKSTK